MRYIFILILTLFRLVGFTQNQTIELCPGQKNTFNYYSQSSTNGGLWMWTLQGDTIGYTNNVRITWRDTGIYVISVKYKDNCGQPEKKFRVMVVKCPESAIFFPTAFTPNGDGLNDKWSPIPFRIVEMKWSVWSRFGEKIYESKNIEDKWDGKHRGVTQGTFSFVFQCWWRGVDGKTGFKKGNLILIR
jgi:gliding motility-associated-like protein